MNYIELLLNNNYVSIPDSNKENLNNNEAVATIAMNIAYYGRSLSQEAFNKLKTLDTNDLVNWWQSLEVELKKITGAHLQMGKHIVYKNFPKEVLDKSGIQNNINSLKNLNLFSYRKSSVNEVSIIF